MTTSTNQLELIRQLENTQLLNGRYEKLSCVNVVGGDRRGVLSLVFQGFDQAEKALVAIKVMDPDRLGDTYRLAAFEREPKILEIIEGKKRCLQVKNGLKQYEWEVTLSGGTAPLKFQCGFFVTEWIEEDVDDYFFQQDTCDPKVKLAIFRKLLLAVDSLHKTHIFHRDLKVDNIRVKTIDNEQIVIAIDFGTAARNDMK